MKKVLLFFILIVTFQTTLSQENFYKIDTIQEIRIYFEQNDWDELLDGFFIAGEKERLLCSLSINGVGLDSVGIRYKGFSSVSVDRKKNPLNIKLDYINGNQKYDGIDKIKLSNVIQDPSFIRETLSYEIGRKYMPASEANFAEVYINDEYWGLYTNVEAVNKDFTEKHFDSRRNPFFKGAPENLDLDGDDNSNLSNEHGTDTTAYYPFYDLESDYGWADLYELIDILNENPSEIESILNVDRTLWMHAFNYALINFDSYIGFAQNYYLYKDDRGIWNPILWDLNQSFASYRLTDASEHFDGFSIEQAKTMDPLLHHSSISIYPRPLMRNLFENDTYRRMYIAHLRTIIEENFASGDYAIRGQAMQDLIENSVLADTNKFYGDDDFYNNLDVTVQDLVEYPGIADLMEGRTNYLQNYPGYQGAPTISNIQSSPQNISIGDNIWLTAEISITETATVFYRFSRNDIFHEAEMFDDGAHNDGAAGDGIFGAEIPNIGHNIQYYLYAENSMAGRFSPERAAYEFYKLQANINELDVVINEFMAKNTMTVTDNSGKYDDWIEFYNNTDFEVSLGGLYLTDDPDNLQKWAFPNVSIAPDDYLIVWADEDSGQVGLHANFKLSGNGEEIFLSAEDGTIIDSITFGEQEDDISMSRIPNGTGTFTTSPPTFNAPNSLSNNDEILNEIQFSIFPNPAQKELFLNFENEIPNKIQIHAIDGKLLQVFENDLNNNVIEIPLNHLSNGLYYLNLQFENGIVNQKIVLNN